MKAGSKFIIFAVFLAVFVSGWYANDIYSFVMDLNKEQPFSLSSNEVKSPGDWIKESQVKIRDNAVTIIISNATWSKFTDTNSMDPVIDAESHAIKQKPSNINDLTIGDIVSYKSETIDGIIIHRIIDSGSDDEGPYFVTKGDNNKYPDAQKVRFEQITGVVVGILY